MLDSFSNSMVNLNYRRTKNGFNLQGQYSLFKFSRKDALTGNSENIKDLVFQDQHLMKVHQICWRKLNSKEI